MSHRATSLPGRVSALVAVFSLATSGLLVVVVPALLLLPEPVATAVKRHLSASLAAASILGFLVVVIRLRRHRELLGALSRGSRKIEPRRLTALGFEAGRLTERWLLPYVLLEGTLATPLRPPGVGTSTAISVALLSAICTGAASLFLYGVIRPLFLETMELAPQETMQEVIDAAERTGVAGARIARRLRIAVAMPVAFVALGAALVASAHARRVELETRETTARVLEQAVFDGPAGADGIGRARALTRLETLGIRATTKNGRQGLVLPPASVPVLGIGALLVSIVAVVLAGYLGFRLGAAHSADLKHATDGVRILGTEAVIRGGRLHVRPPRFGIVADLEAGIEDLAERFRIFAGAQERAILSREAATRTRGLFFASVSHDLKNPLNAILGFCELVRTEPLTSGQAESLGVIHRRGRELLVLIETILDAARVEAGQLSLLIEPSSTRELFRDARSKTRDLAPEQSIEVSFEVAEGAEELDLDSIRMARALATLIAFAMRESRGSRVEVRAAPEGRSQDAIRIDVPGRLSAEQLEKTLTSAGQPGAGEHRGLALALSLARSVVVLHGGTLGVATSSGGAPAFLIRIPRRSSRIPV